MTVNIPNIVKKKMESNGWAKIIFSNLITAILVLIPAIWIMHERFVRVETIQTEIRTNIKDHNRKPYHEGMRDWALSEEYFKDWAKTFEEKEVIRIEAINDKLVNIEKRIERIE